MKTGMGKGKGAHLGKERLSTPWRKHPEGQHWTPMKAKKTVCELSGPPSSIRTAHQGNLFGKLFVSQKYVYINSQFDSEIAKHEECIQGGTWLP